MDSIIKPYDQSIPDHRQFYQYDETNVNGRTQQVRRLISTQVQECNPDYTRGKVTYIGQLIHHTSLTDNTEELITLKINDDYVGQKVTCTNNSDVFSYSRGIVNNISYDIASPIVAVESALKHDVSIMVSNNVSRCVPDYDTGYGTSWINISILTHGNKPNEYNKLSFQIKNFNFMVKTLYIEKFNVFISGRDLHGIRQALIDQQEMLFRKRNAYKEKPAISLRFITDKLESHREFIHFNANGIQGTTLVERGMDEGSFVIFETNEGYLKSFKVPNFDFFTETKILSWKDDNLENEVILCFDDDLDRLHQTVARTKTGHKSAKEVVNSHIKEMEARIEKLNANKEMLIDKNKSLHERINQIEDDLSTYKVQEKLDQEIQEFNYQKELHKLNNTNEAIKNEINIKKEQIKLESARQSAKASGFSDTVKVASAVIGGIGIIKTVVTAVAKSKGGETAKKFIENISPKNSMIIGGLFLLGCGLFSIVSTLFKPQKSS